MRNAKPWWPTRRITCANFMMLELLSPHVQPLIAQLNGVLGTADNTADVARKRIRFIGAAARRMHLSNFETVGSALLRRKRLMIEDHPVVGQRRIGRMRRGLIVTRICN